MAYLGETCPYCNGEGYIRRCPQCGNTKVKVIDVPGIWWEWRCECGWKFGRRTTAHGLKRHRLYRIWSKMKERCNNPRSKFYELYGGRGIKVCEEWANDFQAFYDWAMANGYREGLTIDRKNNDGDYEPENCRWVTRKIQNNNMRRNVLYTVDGETHTQREWEEILGMRRGSLYKIRQKGESVEEFILKAISERSRLKNEQVVGTKKTPAGAGVGSAVGRT